MNLYSKVYRKSEEITNGFDSPADAMAKSLESCARMLEKLAVACETQNYEDRANWSEKIVLILDYIQSSLDRETPAQQKAAKAFESFSATMSGVITGVNATNNPDLARRIIPSVNQLAQMFRG